jgi:hypothetical protein
MIDTPEKELIPRAAEAAPPADRRGNVVLVAGSGRSGTSLLSGVLQRLGFHVPQPEVPADETNPRGFGESQWVVDFHVDLLARVRVQTSDARPAAWALTAEISFEEAVERRLRGWLQEQLSQADNLVIKDPRLSWFLPLWRRCATDLGARPSFATMLRHPAAVVGSKQRWYGTRQGVASRTCGWLNQVLFTERGTRDGVRAFIRYDELLSDWARSVGRLGEILDLPLGSASSASMRGAEQFVDPRLSRSQGSWESLEVPETLRDRAEAVWQLALRLADEDCGSDALYAELDRAREGYVELYERAEAIAQSSIWAARNRSGSSRRRRFVRAVPKSLRRRVPPRLRRATGRLLS